MRPASHMPEAERMTLGVLSKLMALDSSLVMARCRPRKVMGLMPWRMSSVASSSKSARLSWKMLVASTASGLSTIDGEVVVPVDEPGAP